MWGYSKLGGYEGQSKVRPPVEVLGNSSEKLKEYFISH